MENNLNRELSENELNEIFGGMNYELDLKTMTATVTLDENEDAAVALNKIMGQLPKFVKVSDTVLTKMNALAGDMGTNGPRACQLAFVLKGLTVNDVTCTIL